MSNRAWALVIGVKEKSMFRSRTLVFLSSRGATLVEGVIALGVAGVVALAGMSLTKLATSGGKTVNSIAAANQITTLVRQRVESPDLCIQSFLLNQSGGGDNAINNPAGGFLRSSKETVLDANSGNLRLLVSGVKASNDRSGESNSILNNNKTLLNESLSITDIQLRFPRQIKQEVINDKTIVTGLADLYIKSRESSKGLHHRPRYVATLLMQEDITNPASAKFVSCRASGAIAFSSMCVEMGCVWNFQTDQCRCNPPELEGCPPYHVPVGFTHTGHLDCRRIGGGTCEEGYAVVALEADKTSCAKISDLNTLAPLTYQRLYDETCDPTLQKKMYSNFSCLEVETTRPVEMASCDRFLPPAPQSGVDPCVIAVDGLCKVSPQYECQTGTSINQNETDREYTWSCQGINGGKTDECSIAKDIPPVVRGNPTFTATSTYNRSHCRSCDGRLRLSWNTRDLSCSGEGFSLSPTPVGELIISKANPEVPLSGALTLDYSLNCSGQIITWRVRWTTERHSGGRGAAGNHIEAAPTLLRNDFL